MKSVLITGCSDGGIGSALALAFAQRGLLVFASTRKVSNMTKLEELPNVHLLTLDVTKLEDVLAATAFVKKETGGTLDFLVNNAAQTRYMPLLDEEDDFKQAKELFELCLWSQLRMVQAFTPLLIEANGTAVYVSSVSGYLNMPWQGLSLRQSRESSELTYDVKELMRRPNARRRLCSTSCV
jgi:1-acylglycerone phosphate reductase